MLNLEQLLSQEPLDITAISELLECYLGKAVNRVNSQFGPSRLGKGIRECDPLPTDPRQLSSYRTRIGTMLEYAISTELHKILQDEYEGKFFLTFAPAHEYPDFFLRDNTMSALLKIEMKAVDAESDEQAARFSTSTDCIDHNRDMLLLVGWNWEDLPDREGIIIGEYPHIFASTLLSAGEIARERDIRLSLTNGKIVEGKVYVYSDRVGDFVPDPGNYGKFWRIIHASRRDNANFSETIKKFLGFLEKVDERSPRRRFHR